MLSVVSVDCNTLLCGILKQGIIRNVYTLHGTQIKLRRPSSIPDSDRRNDIKLSTQKQNQD